MFCFCFFVFCVFIFLLFCIFVLFFLCVFQGSLWVYDVHNTQTPLFWGGGGCLCSHAWAIVNMWYYGRSLASYDGLCVTTGTLNYHIRPCILFHVPCSIACNTVWLCTFRYALLGYMDGLERMSCNVRRWNEDEVPDLFSTVIWIMFASVNLEGPGGIHMWWYNVNRSDKFRHTCGVPYIFSYSFLLFPASLVPWYSLPLSPCCPYLVTPLWSVLFKYFCFCQSCCFLQSHLVSASYPFSKRTIRKLWFCDQNMVLSLHVTYQRDLLLNYTRWCTHLRLLSLYLQ